MKTSPYLLLSSLFLLCGAFLLGQRHHNQNLRKELAKAKQSSSLVLPTHAPEVGTTSSRAEESPEIKRLYRYRQQTNSDQRITEAREQINALCERKPNPSTSAKALLFIKELLPFIQALDADELNILLRDLMDGSSNHLAQAASSTNYSHSLILLMLQTTAAEMDPLQELKKLETTPIDSEILAMKFGSIARQNPEAASAWLEYDCPPEQKEELSEIFLNSILLEHPERLAAMIHQHGPPSSDVPLPAETLDILRTVFQDPVNSDIQNELAHLIVQSQARQGIEIAQQEAEALNLTHAQLLSVFKGSLFSEEIEQAPFLNWMLESAAQSGAPYSLQNTISHRVSSWASSDIKSSADWMNNLDPSPNKDKAIKGFTSAVQGIDPEAATLWADQIEDSTLRQKVLQSTLTEWEQQDSSAATQWRKENNLLPERTNTAPE